MFEALKKVIDKCSPSYMKGALQVTSCALSFKLEERIKKMGYALLDLQRFPNAFQSQDTQLVLRIRQNTQVDEWNAWLPLPSSKLQSSLDTCQVGSRWNPTINEEEEKCASWDCDKSQSVCGWGGDFDVCKNSNVQRKKKHGCFEDRMEINSRACNGLHGCDAMEE